MESSFVCPHITANWKSLQLSQHLFKSFHPFVLACDSSSDLFIARLDVQEVILIDRLRFPTQVSFSNFAGLPKVLIIGIDFNRLLKPSQSFLLASLLLGDPSADESSSKLPSVYES